MTRRAKAAVFFIVCGTACALVAVGLLCAKLLLLGILSGSESDKLLLALSIKTVVVTLCFAVGLLLLGVSLLAPRKEGDG